MWRAKPPQETDSASCVKKKGEEDEKNAEKQEGEQRRKSSHKNDIDLLTAPSAFRSALKTVAEFAWIWKCKELLHPLKGRLSRHGGARTARAGDQTPGLLVGLHPQGCRAWSWAGWGILMERMGTLMCHGVEATLVHTPEPHLHLHSITRLNRAVVSDPEQSTPADVCKDPPGLLALGTAPMRYRRRTLHETKVRTTAGLTAEMLSNKLCFGCRILSRNGHDACRELTGFFFTCDGSLTVYEFRKFGKNSSLFSPPRTTALPFIQKGVYQHQRGQRKGKPYGLRDFCVGANLTFLSVEHNLPESCRQSPVLTLRVISTDEAALGFLKAASVGFKEECSEQVADGSKVLEKIQGRLRETLSKRGVRVLTGIGKHFREADANRSGLLPRAAFKEALQVFHLGVPEGDLEALWLALDDSKSDKVDYGDFTRAVFGEMSEHRKAFVRKAYMKLDPSKTGSVPLVDIRKCYCAKKHPLVLAGKATDEEIKSAFLETLGESCSSPTQVSYAEFEAYYEGLSFGVVDDDDFVNVLKNSWGV
ncbi:calcyphosin-2 isoform X5 [Pogoniulus pusillus]|uniref:calcyphosin-2 isoform X5 n=1 Tax=Pogoniulus pusillus TaxID=488313 RepID=UPI0030B95329